MVKWQVVCDTAANKTNRYWLRRLHGGVRLPLTLYSCHYRSQVTRSLRQRLSFVVHKCVSTNNWSYPQWWVAFGKGHSQTASKLDPRHEYIVLWGTARFTGQRKVGLTYLGCDWKPLNLCLLHQESLNLSDFIFYFFEFWVFKWKNLRVSSQHDKSEHW